MMRFIFVCLVTLSDNFWEKNKTTVITVKLASAKIQELINKGHDIEELDLKEELFEKTSA